MTATVAPEQLAFPTDARADDLPAQVIAGDRGNRPA